MSDEEKQEIKETAAAVELVAEETAVDGALKAAEGVDELRNAELVGLMGRVVMAAGASDATHGVDEMIVAERAAVLSEAVAEAGVTDVAEGAMLLAASDDIAVQSALIGSLGIDDLTEATDLGLIAGQLESAGEVVGALDMPVLSAFLADKSAELQEIALDKMYRSAAKRILASSVGASGTMVEELGSNEVAEGLTRLVVSDAMFVESEELAAEGIVDIAEGSAELGAASVMETAVESLEEDEEA